MKKVRYGVLGLGHIAQTAVLPAFKNARQNSELTALISSDPVKLKTVSKKYKVANTYNEDEFLSCLESNVIDALYIATPNTDHQYYAERAMEYGIHILCEKPLATNSTSCRSMLKVSENAGVKLMVAYRLHFDPANLQAVSVAQSGKLGDLRYFNSTFSFQVKDLNNIRLRLDKGGGPLHDIGIYCINAARYLFAAEPIEVMAQSATHLGDARFLEVPEMLSVTMRFPDSCLASFICSFGAGDSSQFTLMGTKGSLTLESAYEYAAPRLMTVKVGEKKKLHRFDQYDQFAPELLYFSNCIQKNLTPEPSGLEGLADLVVIEAIETSLKVNRSVMVEPIEKVARPTLRQKIQRPAVAMPKTVHVTAPSGKH